MADLTFNTAAGQTIDRELLIVYLNTGTSAESPTWTAIGKRVEESTAELDWGQESKQDVLGNTSVSYTHLGGVRETANQRSHRDSERLAIHSKRWYNKSKFRTSETCFFAG